MTTDCGNKQKVRPDWTDTAYKVKIKTMSRKASNPNAPKMRVFTIARPKGKLKPVAKISIPRVSFADLPETLEKLLGSASEVNPSFARGTITLYGSEQ